MSKPTKRKTNAEKRSAPTATRGATANARAGSPASRRNSAHRSGQASAGKKAAAPSSASGAKAKKGSASHAPSKGSAKNTRRANPGPSRKQPIPAQSASLAGSVLWTKDAPKNAAAGRSVPARIFGAVFGFFAALCKGIGRGLAGLFGLAFSSISRSKVAVVVSVLLLVGVCAGGVDFGLNWGKIYPGVKVGELDLGGKSVEDARSLIEETYGPRLAETNVYVFANEQAAADIEAAKAQTEEADSDEMQSIEDARANKVLWITDASMLAAHVATDELVQEAVDYGREDGGILNRIKALWFGYDIKPRAAYDTASVEALAADIDASIGDPRVNFNIVVEEGVASVVEGRDGTMINRDTFTDELDAAFLDDGDTSDSFIAQVEYAPLQITREQAQQVCDQVNGAIAQGAEFDYEGTGWFADPATLGSWIRTEVVKAGEGWELSPYIDPAAAKGIILSHLKANITGGEFKVRFSVENGQPLVHTDAKGTIPLVSEAVETLDGLLFPTHAQGEEGEGGPAPSMPTISMLSTGIPETLPFETALENGIITTISEYTTEYTSGALGRNHNIHLAADILSNSIVSGGGGTWSFNDVAGNCNEAAGFQSAGTIQDGEYVDDIGGGICQVATTLFNAVYEAGYPIPERHNHSLHIASYPDGRDAAVSWPDLNFVWKNDSPSDVLVRLWYTDTTVTAALYGVSPEYQVSTSVGEWQEGEKYKTKTVVDETLAPGDSYIKSGGVDGSRITVVRTVKDKNGTILHEDVFGSVYDPKNEVKVEGPKAAAPDVSSDGAENPDSGGSGTV